jgi:hypothetical protein
MTGRKEFDLHVIADHIAAHATKEAVRRHP